MGKHSTVREHRLVSIASLETRRMMAARIEIFQLLVDGSASDDTVTVAFNANTGQVDVTVNGALEGSFAPTQFNQIHVDCLAGNDQVSINCKRSAVIEGGAGDDTLTGGAGNDSLGGAAGNDLLDGGSGFDALYGDTSTEADAPLEVGNDQLFGRSDSDALYSNGGSDLVDGGSGNADSANFDRRTDDLILTLDGLANDGAAGEATQLLAIEAVSGGSGDDSLIGNGGDNDLVGAVGVDTLLGMGGDDTLVGGIGGGDADTDVSGDRLDGGSGNDFLQGDRGDDSLFGRSGNDTLNGGVNDDSIFAGSGDDQIELSAVRTGLANPGGDSAQGDGGNDTFSIFAGTHIADGGSGVDFFLIGTEGSATVRGSGGVDAISVAFDGYTGTFDASGGSGIDRVDFSTVEGANVSLDNVANDGLSGNGSRDSNVRSDFEQVNANIGDDLIDLSSAPHGISVTGSLGDDTIIGSAFADQLEGGEGNDSISGGAGEDVLRGQGGSDTLTGNSGPDSFNGGHENDALNAADGEADTVNGAQGLGDSADVDELLDTLIRVETST